jgi:hypothetical protein
LCRAILQILSNPSSYPALWGKNGAFKTEKYFLYYSNSYKGRIEGFHPSIHLECSNDNKLFFMFFVEIVLERL